MADNTLIEWARHPVTGKGATWNIVTGCSVVSPGCTNCYAMKLAGTRLKHTESRKGLTIDTKAGPVWNGKISFNEQWLTQPLCWKTPRGIFVAAHGDLFAEGVTDYQLDQIFSVMAMAHQHVFFVLTKRPERMRGYVRALPARASSVAAAGANIWGGVDPDAVYDWIAENIQHALPNVWLGVSVEDQTRADSRIPVLLDTPAAIRFISAEPLLGPVDFYRVSADMPGENHPWKNGPILQGIDWVIAGGESGPNARPMHPDWARTLRDQGAEAAVPYFFKQWGNWTDHEPGKIGDHTPYALANDGTLYKLTDLAYPDGPSRAAAIAADHDKAHLTTVYNTTKKSAGRLLDGVTHDAMPDIRS